MLSVKIETTTIKFKNNLQELSVLEFSENIKKEIRIDNVLKQADQLSGNIEQLYKRIDNLKLSEEDLRPGIQDEIQTFEADCLNLIQRALMLRVEQLAALTVDPSVTEDFLTTTKGIDADILRNIYKKVNEGFGDPLTFFNETKPIQSFRFDDFKRHGLFRLKRTNFHVYDLDSQTVIRDAAATMVGQQIGTFRKQFEKNDWRNFARFVAYVARPKKEEFEYLPKERLRSFIGGNWFERMSPADRLSAYNQKLAEVVEERTVIFESLPLPVAIGIYKYYFFLKKNFQTSKNTKAYIKRTSKQQSKRSRTIKDSELKQVSKT